MTVLDRPLESKTAEIVENGYRANIIAFLDERSTFSEKNVIDLIKVIGAIKIRPTNDNMIFPELGIAANAFLRTAAWACESIDTS